MTPRKGRRGEPLVDRLIRRIEATETEHRWPSSRWRDDPEGFFREVLMVPFLSDDQIAILRAMNKRRARVSVSSGHKMGKDFLAAGIALWWYCSDEEARVRATAVTAAQVRDAFWRELRSHWERSHHHRDGGTGRMVKSPYPIDGVPSAMPYPGLRSGLREVVGFTVAQQEGAAGISSRRMLYIFDEASGIDDSVFEASKGNFAGGDARCLMLSQPTRSKGHFYDSHHSKRDLWTCFTLDSENSPNVLAGREIVPGMADREWLAEQAIDWGAPKGPLWLMRVKGQFVEGGETRVILLALAEEATKRWEGMPLSRERLVIGLDVAGTGDDENVAAPRRGQKILELVAWNTPEAREEVVRARLNASKVMGVVRRHRREREMKPLVIMDAGGTVGIAVYRELLKYPDEIDVRPIQFGAASPLPGQYQVMRDHLWFGFLSWLEEGGAIPPDAKLSAELTAPAWWYDERQRKHVEKKDSLRKRLGRSTDRADACLLSVHVPASAWDEGEDEHAAPAVEQVDPIYDAIDPRAGGFDPYAGAMRRGSE